MKKALRFIYIIPVLLLPLATQAIVSHFIEYSSYPRANPEEDFTVVCDDSRYWQKLGQLGEKITIGQDDPNFLFGVATSTYQDSGSVHSPHSQWVKWEEVSLLEENRSGNSANLFELYQTHEGREELITRLHKLGSNSYRFSVEWSQIEPQEGTFNQQKMNIYVALCQELRKAGIRPMVTLHHFSEPSWFHDLGSFEDEDNIEYFIKYCQFVYLNLTKPYEETILVDCFCTINEPAVEALSRYVRGAFSPGIIGNFERAGNFLKGALKAHVRVYEALKEICSDAQIGITHQRLVFHSTHLLLKPLAYYLTHLVNDVTLHYFKTGDFELKIPFLCHISEKGERPKTDFVGLQYYVRPVLGLTGSTSYHEPMTQMPLREDPEGLYEAIIEVYNAFEVPIIITENGISTHDETQRFRYIERSLYAAQRAQDKIGKENLQGYYLWSFCDNAEWDMGIAPQAFGAYSIILIDGKKVLSNEPKLGVIPFIRAALAWKTINSKFINR